MPEIHKHVIDAAIHDVNSRIDPLGRLHYFGRDTETGNARIVLYTDGDAYGRLAVVGTPRECLLFLRGMIHALELT
jgi:hypothetical protein